MYELNTAYKCWHILSRLRGHLIQDKEVKCTIHNVTKKGLLIKNIQFKITLVKNCRIFFQNTQVHIYINIIFAYNI